MTTKDKAIHMMQRPQGVSGPELEKALGWLRHTVRGFVSLLGSRGGVKVRRMEKDNRAAYVIRTAKRSRS